MAEEVGGDTVAHVVQARALEATAWDGEAVAPGVQTDVGPAGLVRLHPPATQATGDGVHELKS